jgi:hypothetical protein
VTWRARQREQAEALVRGHGRIVAELFDVGESRTVAWARRPQAAALVAQTMTVLGLSSKREITRTSIRVRTAMAAQTREQGRYLGGRPPYGYRLADAGPHPNKAHAAWGGGRTAWIPIPGRRRWCGGSSPSGWPGIR